MTVLGLTQTYSECRNEIYKTDSCLYKMLEYKFSRWLEIVQSSGTYICKILNDDVLYIWCSSRMHRFQLKLSCRFNSKMSCRFKLQDVLFAWFRPGAIVPIVWCLIRMKMSYSHDFELFVRYKMTRNMSYAYDFVEHTNLSQAKCLILWTPP